MIQTIQSPKAGDPMCASWAKDVSDACNGVALAGAPDSLVRDGAGAFGLAPLPRNLRERKARATDAGCFKIDDMIWNGDMTRLTVVFGNCFWRRANTVKPFVIERAGNPEGDPEEDAAGDPEVKLKSFQRKMIINRKALANKPVITITFSTAGFYTTLFEGVTPEGQSSDSKSGFVLRSIDNIGEIGEDANVAYIPLYWLGESGNILCDFRTAPGVQLWEA